MWCKIDKNTDENKCKMKMHAQKDLETFKPGFGMSGYFKSFSHNLSASKI